MWTNFCWDEAKKNNWKIEKMKFKMADSKKGHFSKSPILNIFLWKFYGLVLGLVDLIDAKGEFLVQGSDSGGTFRILFRNLHKIYTRIHRSYLHATYTEWLVFFESAILNFLFQKKKIFYFIVMKISHKLCVRMDGSQFLLLWWFTAKNERGNDKTAWV